MVRVYDISDAILKSNFWKLNGNFYVSLIVEWSLKLIEKKKEKKNVQNVAMKARKISLEKGRNKLRNGNIFQTISTGTTFTIKG